MVTKAELQNQVNELSKALAESRAKVREYAERYLNLQASIDQKIEDAMYSKFKNRHGDFLNRFMKEWVSEHLSVTGNGSEYGYLDLCVNVDGKTTHFETCEIEHIKHTECYC